MPWEPGDDIERDDDDSLNIRYDREMRLDINQAFRETAQNLKNTDPELYRNTIRVFASAMGVTPGSMARYVAENNYRDFIGKGLPSPKRLAIGENNTNFRLVSGEQQYKMRVALARAFILGQITPPGEGTHPSGKGGDRKVQNMGGSNVSVKETARRLRSYLLNPYTRTKAVRLRIDQNNLFAWEYRRYPEYPDEEEEASDDLNNWWTTLDSVNPDIFNNLNFPEDEDE